VSHPGITLSLENKGFLDIHPLAADQPYEDFISREVSPGI
jgi:hypothetical protein